MEPQKELMLMLNYLPMEKFMQNWERDTRKKSTETARRSLSAR